METDLWTVDLEVPRRVILSSEEEARAARFRFEEDRVRWARARSALREAVGEYAGIHPEAVGFVYGEQGKPALAGSALEFNLSHAGTWAFIAVAGTTPVGVDIERLRERLDMAPLLRRLGETDLPETAQELYQRWTIREARSKAAGGALFDTPREQVHAVAVEAPPGYCAAVALVGQIPVVRYCGRR